MKINSNRQKIILASASIARKQILEQAGFMVIVKPTDAIEENSVKYPGENVKSLSQYKLDIFKRQTPNWETLRVPVITADTIVLCREVILGKPLGKDIAKQMLQQLSGKVHSVYTGFSILFPGIKKCVSGYEAAEVTFFPLSSNDIDKYLDTNEWMRAAGAYKVQGVGLRLISSIKGSYFTIAGLPIHQISGILREQGF
ncbi:MAG: septum formation protein Maf [Bacteroidetes bacterium]|nr:septum formation protein Maf [Bacteroidota bacterium]